METPDCDLTPAELRDRIVEAIAQVAALGQGSVSDVLDTIATLAHAYKMLGH